MSNKRQRVALELPSVGQAALPAVCYLPSIAEAGQADNNSPEATEAATQSPVKRLKFSLHTKKSYSSNIQLVHAALGEIDYVGRSDGDENAGVQPCYYALGVFRPGESKLQLVSVAGDRLFRLDSRLPGLVYAPTGKGADEDANVRERRIAAAKKLVDEFGSTRRRRQLTAREAGVVSAERISGGEAVKEVLGGVAQRGEVVGLTREEVARRAFERRTVPPHDPAATTAAKAYPLELLLGRGGAAEGAGGFVDGAEMVAELGVALIQKLVDNKEEAEKAREKELIHPYVLSRLAPLRALKLSDERYATKARQRSRYLALLATLMRLESKPVLGPRFTELKEAAKELRVTERLAEVLLDKFYVQTDDALRGQRYTRSDAQKQLLLSYILAVAIVAEDGFMDKEEFEELRAGLKLDASKLATAMQQLGCTVKPTKITVVRSGQALELPAYTTTLLRTTSGGVNSKTLAECFPAIKVGKGGKGR